MIKKVNGVAADRKYLCLFMCQLRMIKIEDPNMDAIISAFPIQ